MDLAVIEPALLDWAHAITGVERACCVWANAPAVRSNGALVRLSWVSNAAVGTDATTYAFDAAAPSALTEMVPTVSGDRALVLQVDVEVQQQTPGVNAMAVMTRAQTRARWPSALDALSAVGLALASVEATRTTDYPVDGRWVSRRTMDVHLNAVASETDTAGATSSIATVETTASITHPDGTAVDPDAQPGGTLP